MKQLKGESTRAEDSELQNWLYESEQNQEIFKQVANLWKVTQPISERFFEEMFNSGVFVGQLRTRLGIPSLEKEGPDEAAKALFEVIRG